MTFDEHMKQLRATEEEYYLCLAHLCLLRIPTARKIEFWVLR